MGTPERGREPPCETPDRTATRPPGAGSAAALPEEVPEDVKLRGLPWLLTQNALNAIFGHLTVFGPLFVLFLDELGLPKAQMGLLLSLLPFCGLLALGSASVVTRLGRRRVFLVCWTARKFVMGGLLLLPLVMSRFGEGGGLVFLIAIVGIFAVLRSLAETAWYPWLQEAVPDRVRGRFGANATVLATVATIIALVIAGQVLGDAGGVDRFMILFAGACVVGLVGVAAMVPVPGGRPRPATGPHDRHVANMIACLRDRNFVFYLFGLGGVTVGTVMYIAFLPLFLKDRLGLAPGIVVTMETSVMIGGALSALLWGWAADRVGSRPVLMTSVALTLLIPLGWLVLPRAVPHLLVWCGLLYFTHGMAFNGGMIGSMRLLYNGVVPPMHSTAYTALYYAWLGLVGGAAPLLAGALLDAYGPWQARVIGVTADGHAVLFALAALLIALGAACYARVQPDDRYRTRDVIHAVRVRVLHRLWG